MNITAEALETVIMQLSQENAALRLQLAQLQLDANKETGEEAGERVDSEE